MKVLEEPGRTFLIELERLMSKFDIVFVEPKKKPYKALAEFVASNSFDDDDDYHAKETNVVVDLPRPDGKWQTIVLPYRPYDEEAWGEGEEDA